jgi:DNA-binding NarL/FixJ family response regulator
VKPIFKEITQVAVATKDTEGAGSSFPEVIYCHRDELMRFSMEQGCLQFHGPFIAMDVNEETNNVSIVVRPVEQEDSAPVYLMTFESENSTASINERLNFLGLSNREQEVVCLLCEGLENSEIAKRLCVSKYTVQNHLKSIFQKMNIRNRASLIHKVMTFK